MKKENKLAQQLQEEELRILFNEGIANQFGKKKSVTAAKAGALGLTEQSKEIAAFMEGISSDDSDDESDNDDGPIFIDDEPEATVIFREKTIEDIIEEQRAKLAAEGKKGTPVTAESFATWRTAKLAQKQAEAEARVKAELTKKKGGKGLCKSFSSGFAHVYMVALQVLFLFFAAVLSGKELFNYNSSLFVDDDGAIDESEEQAMNADMLKRKEMEEAKAREEAERIQAEQERLAELQKIEFEVRQRKEADRRLYAAAPNRATFVLAGVTINQVVFEDDEEEDLTPFPEETLVEAEVVEEGHYATEGISEELKEAYLQGSDDENEDGEGEEGEDGEGSDGEEGESEGEGEEESGEGGEETQSGPGSNKS